jgi:hypothetical protein
MASAAPYDQLDGIELTLYIAPVGEAIPAVNATCRKLEGIGRLTASEREHKAR